MKTQVPWLRVFVEGVVIVGSILLAFGIDAAWEEKQERQEEQELLLGLYDEFTANREALVSQIQRARLMAVDSYRLLEWGRRAADPLPSDSLRLVLQSVLHPQTLEARMGVVNEVLNAGNLRLIRNGELRTVVAAWPDLYREAVDREPWEHVVVHEQLRVHISRLMFLPPLRSGLPAWRERDDTWREFSQEVVHDGVFLSLLSARLDWVYIVLREKRSFLDRVDGVLRVLEDELTAHRLAPVEGTARPSVPSIEALIESAVSGTR